jgi:Domain of unknown function (DUF4292)
MKKLFFLIFIFSLTSCSVFKNISNKPDVVQEFTLDSIYSKTDDFETLSYRFAANYTSPDQSLSFFGSVKMIKDSLLYMKISPGLGITIAEVFATPDTFLIYMPMQNQYFAGNDKLLLNMYGIPLNFTSVQNLLTARFFSYPYFIDVLDYELFITDTTTSFENIVNPKDNKIPDVVHNFDIDNSYLIEKLIINDNVLHKDLEAQYEDYKIYDNIYFPSAIFLSLFYLDTLTLNFKNKKVVFNEPVSINFSIPDDAKVISN